MQTTRTYRSKIRDRQAAETKRQILEAAMILFSEKGFSSTTIRAIAQSAEVTPQTIYGIFGSKNGLVGELVGFANEKSGTNELSKKIQAATTAFEMIQLSVNLVCVLHERIGRFVLEMSHAAEFDESIRGAINSGRSNQMTIRKLRSARLEKSGFLLDDLDAETANGLLAVAVTPEVIQSFVANEGWDYQKIEDELTKAVLRMLCKPGTEHLPLAQLNQEDFSRLNLA
ncbi:MAG: TetR/AcrR family transcriptional regulator [Cryobacterium sp.]|nr:TetR/AcrR family transcriptional regulator [Cryobacterium sp.]MBX3104944.1 TetR/AcrR family transcriptional regulator [Cryobacterium sp.]